MSAVDLLDVDVTAEGDVDAYHFQYEWETDVELGTTIVLALEHVLERAAVAETPLHDVVDPDALERAFAPVSAAVPRDHGEVSFRFAAATVTVYANGRVVIRPDPAVETNSGGATDA